MPKDDPDTLDYLCACETYIRPIVMKDSDAELKENICHTIASVVSFRYIPAMSVHILTSASKFTPAHQRKRGYAKKMMVLLHEKLAQDAILSVLYSDVGDFYRLAKREHDDPDKAKGWDIVAPYHVVWLISDVNDGTAATPDFQSVQEKDFHRIAKRDAALLKRELSASEAGDTDGKAFIILPEGDQLDWLVGRAKFHGNPKYDPSRAKYCRIVNFGCERSSQNDTDWSYAIWTYDFVGKQVDIIRLRAHSPADLVAIVNLAMKAGEEQGMTKVTAWNVDPRLFPKGSEWKNEAREEHLPAMAWYGEGKVPHWRHVEHYSWC